MSTNASTPPASKKPTPKRSQSEAAKLKKKAVNAVEAIPIPAGKPKGIARGGFRKGGYVGDKDGNVTRVSAYD